MLPPYWQSSTQFYLIRNCFPQVPFGHPGYEVKNEVADVIIADTRPEGKQ